MFDIKYTISGDYEMWCRMKSKGYTFMKLEEPLGVYFHNPTGVSTLQDGNRHAEQLRQDTVIRNTYK